MSSNTSHQSLKWTRPLIEELGQEILLTLESWNKAGADREASALDAAITAARRMGGSLSVLEFNSGELLGSAMADTLEALQQEDFEHHDKALDALLEACATLPDYLDFLESTHRDAPLLLLPTINKLRRSIGAAALEEAEFFQPPLDQVELPAEGASTSVGELHRRYQSILPRVLLNSQDQTALNDLTEVSMAMRDDPQLPDSARRAAWAAAAVSSALADGELDGGAHLNRLYAGFDGLLRKLEEGRHADEQADALCRNFLYQLAAIRPQGEVATAAWHAFHMDEYAPEVAGQARAYLAGRNRALFAAVTKAAREDLAQIKDTLGSQLERSSDPDLINNQAELLVSVSESLAMLGLDRMAQRLHAQADRLSELGSDPDDPALLAVARELLMVESQLEESLGVIEAQAMESDDSEDADATLLPPSEWRRVLRQLFSECSEDLAHAKSLLDALNRGKAEDGAAQDACMLLERIAHVLHMAELHESARMLTASTHLIQAQLIDAETPDPEQLEVLAEALTVMEFYFDSATVLDENAQRYFDDAREHLQTHGYWPEAPEQPEIVDVTADLEEDEAAEAEAPEAAEDIEPEIEVEVEVEAEAEAETEPEFEAEAEEALELEPEPELEPELEPGAEAPVAAAPVSGFSGMDDFDIVAIFLEEFDQENEELLQLIPRWRESPRDEEILTTIRRAFHSLKGSGRMAGAEEIGEFSWQVENMLNRVIDGQLQPEPGVIDTVAAAVEMLPSMRARLSGEGEQPFDEAACTELASIVGQVAELEISADDALALLAGEAPVEAGAEEEIPAEAELETEFETEVEAEAEFEDELEDELETEAEPALEAESEFESELEPDFQAAFDSSDEDESAFEAETDFEAAFETEDDLDDEAEPEPEVEAEAEAEAEAELEPALETDAEEAEPEFLPPELEGLDPTLVELMIKELSENLEVLDEWIEAANAAETLPAANDALVRAVHTMKGTMRMAPIGSENETAQILEQYLEELTYSSESPDDDGFLALLAAQDMFHHRLRRLKGQEVDAEHFETEELSAQLRHLHTEVAREQAGSLAADLRPEPLVEIEETEPVELETLDAEMAEDESLDELEEEELTAEELFGLDETLIDESAAAFETDFSEEPEEVAVPEEEETSEQVELEEVVDADPEVEVEEEREEVEPVAAQEDDWTPPAVAEEPTHITINYEQIEGDLLNAFLEEAEEVLENTDAALQEWREAPDNRAIVTNLQRNLHTIKGSSRMVGLDPVGSVAHVMEELLEGIAAGLHETTTERIDALEAGCDHLHLMINAVIQRQPLPARPEDGLLMEGMEETVEPVLMPAPEELAAADASEDTVKRTETLRVPAALVDDLVNYAGEISIFRSRLEEQVAVFRNNVVEVDETVIRLRDQLRKLEIETEAQILARYEREHGPADETFDPLELDRYSTIQQLSRGLAESVNDLTSLTSILDDATRQSETLLMQQARVNTELQEGLMQARMVAFGTLLPRFRRVIRNSARELDKQVQLAVDIEGDGELDRSVLDRITAPLEHLLRNAVSHGIEMPEQRRALGKPETGTVHIDVRREATELVLRVRDDGAGLDLNAIRRRGHERGLLSSGRDASDQELAQLIFRPGFSTAAEVSELAGRGIGMDVVANEVRQIGGSVTANTDAGQGARFTIRIPLSLTVLQAIMVRVADRQFSIPLQAVRGVTRMLATEWNDLIQSDEPMQEYAGQQYPLLELETQLGFPLDDLGEGTLSLLMIEAGAHRAALRVSELQGHREIVIKPVGPQISSITGILGGTVTGDGQVIPILDMGPLIRRAFDRNLLPGHTDLYERAGRAEEAKRTPLVLVVDDSITMRRVTSRVLEHHGLEVMTARDGLDAVETMFERIPDLILLDIEMPRMDGYELAAHVRNDVRLKHLPMVMITSRSGEKHRQRAAELGVDGYLTKPYQETDLVEEVFGRLQLPVPQG